jgi:hypothetical protein
MAANLAERDTVRTLPLAGYLGRDPGLHVREISGPDDVDFAPTMSCYRAVFGSGGLAVPDEDFRRALPLAGYHLWSVRGSDVDGPVAGIASFFGLATAGFGGYLALVGALHRTGRLRPLVALMEERLLADRPRTRGWYIEVGPDTDPAAFQAIGFHEIAVDYRQPGQPEIATRLFYKPFGRSYGPPALSAGEVVLAVEDILAVVYDIAAPQEHPTYQTIAKALPDPGEAAPLR